MDANAAPSLQECNFGEVILYIIHVLPHDSGVYSCRAYNLAGEATTSATVKVAGYEAIMKDTQHPESWEQIQARKGGGTEWFNGKQMTFAASTIQELERPKIVEMFEMPEVKEKPRFLTQLESVENVQEGTPVRMEATFQPARDNNLKATWELNGQPLGASQLIRTRQDLGWAALDISAVNMDHVGVYTLKIANSEGEAASSASLKVGIKRERGAHRAVRDRRKSETRDQDLTPETEIKSRPILSENREKKSSHKNFYIHNKSEF